MEIKIGDIIIANEDVNAFYIVESIEESYIRTVYLRSLFDGEYPTSWNIPNGEFENSEVDWHIATPLEKELYGL